MGQTLTDRVTGTSTYVDDADMPAALASGKYVAPQAVAVKANGIDEYVSPDLAVTDKQFAPVVDASQAELAQGHAVRAERNSGLSGGVKAFAGRAIDAATGGAISPWEEAAEFNSQLGTAGTVAGLAGTLFIDPESIIGHAADPVEAERAASALSSKFMLGGEATNGVERGLAKGASEVDRAKALAGAPEDLSALDVKGLRAARDSELDTLQANHATERAAAKSSAVDSVVEYQNAVKEANPFLVTGEGSASAPFVKSSKTLRNALDDVEGLRENPGSLLKPLRQQAQALEQTIGEREAIAAKFEATNGRIAKDLELDLQTLPDTATHVELSGKAARRYGAYADVKVAKGGALQVPREDAQGFLRALQGGEVTGEGQAAMDKLQGLLEQNRSLQSTIKTAAAPATARAELTSERLKAINAAHDTLMQPGAKASLGEEMLSGSIMGHVAGMFSGLPIVGPMLGAKAGQLAKDLVFGRLGKATAAAAERTNGAVKAFLATAKASAPVSVPAATRILTSLSFGPKKGEQPKNLAGAFKARTDELKQQVMYAPDGSVQMRPDARDAMAAKLAPIRMQNPKLADQLEEIKARAVQYLAGAMPKRPDVGGLPLGPDHWQASHMEMLSWARKAHAVEDPHGVEERLAHGILSPEDVEAYHAVYPERANALKAQIVESAAGMQTTVPYHKRLALSMFTGTPVDPSMNPTVLAILQGSFTSEPGSNGGTMAPRAQPQFGSVAKTADELSTPAQQRALGSRG